MTDAGQQDTSASGAYQRVSIGNSSTIPEDSLMQDLQALIASQDSKFCQAAHLMQ